MSALSLVVLLVLAACSAESLPPTADAAAGPAAPQPTTAPPAPASDAPQPEPLSQARESVSLAPLRTDDLQAVLGELSPEERSCLVGLGDKAQGLEELVLAAEPSSGGPSRAAMATVIDCVHDETALRVLLTQLIGQTEPLSEQTSACVREGLAPLDPRGLLAPSGAEHGPAGRLALSMAALSVSVACMNDREWATYAPRLGMSAQDREQAACLVDELGGPAALSEAMRAASLGHAPEGLALAGSVCGMEALPPMTEPDDAPAPTASPDPAAFAPQPHIMLRVVLVQDGQDEWPFSSAGGWTQAVLQRESEALRYYEAAIWEETGSVHLYAFPNDYDPLMDIFGDVVAEESIAYREQHAIRVHRGMPEAFSEERSEFLRSAFADFASLLVERHPDAEHHLMYSGHGGPGGDLFEGHLRDDDAGAFLAAWTERLGRPLGVIDMGGPCNKGGYEDLANFCGHARYYVASDLANGGYSMDEWTWEKYHETDAETQYHRLLASNDTLEEALTARVELRRTQYEYSRSNQTRDRVHQASYVYSCSAFNDFSAAFEAFLEDTAISHPTYDLYSLMQEQSAPASLLEGFHSVFVHAVDNRDFFAWDLTANGMISPVELIYRRAAAGDG